MRFRVLLVLAAAACGGGSDDPECENGHCIDPCSPTGMIALLDAADPTPAGWTCISCVEGDPFFERFPVGAAAAGATGGSTNHAHPFTATQMGGSSSTTSIDSTNGTTSVATGPHPMASGMTSVADHLPRYRNMKLIRAITPTSTLPAGAVVVLDAATMPAGFTRYHQQDQAFIRGAGAPGMGGTAEHQHTFDSMLTAPNSVARLTGVDRTVAASSHTHVVTGGSGTFSNDPKHAVVVLARADAPAATPVGAIMMFEQAPPSTWQVVSETGPFAGVFLKGDPVPNLTPPGAHEHGGEVTVMASAASTSVQSVAGNTAAGTGSHTHQVRVAMAAVDHRPPFREVIYAQLMGSCR